MGTSDRFPQGKSAATESRYPILINYKVPAGVISYLYSPPNSDMDYMIFNARTRINLIRAYIHNGGWLGTPTASQHNMFDSEKTLTNCPCASYLTQTGFEPRVFGSRVQRSTN